MLKNKLPIPETTRMSLKNSISTKSQNQLLCLYEAQEQKKPIYIKAKQRLS